MALPDALKAFEHEPGIRSYVRALRAIEKDLAKTNSTITSVELLVKKDQRSALRKFFALEKATDADHWLAVTAVVEGRDVRIQVPFRRGLHLPYSIEIALKGKLSLTASLRINMLRRASWTVLPEIPENQGKAGELTALKLPDVGWRHESGGIPIFLDEGGRLGTQMGNAQKATWTIFSAYQGFLFNVGPRVVKYVKAAPKLDALLERWQSAAPAPARPAVSRPLAAVPDKAPAPTPVPDRPAGAAALASNPLEAALASATRAVGGAEAEASDPQLELPSEDEMRQYRTGGK